MDFDDLGTLVSHGAWLELRGIEQMQYLRKNPGGGEHGTETFPVTGADAGFFNELAFGRLEGRLVRLELSGGKLPNPALRDISVLPQKAYLLLGIHSHNGSTARMVDDVERRAMAVRKDDVVGRDRHDPPTIVNSLLFRFHTNRVCGTFA
jgi:hypothetical protein